ncbi:phage shock E domain protein [Escherichia coli 3-105-05_S3_C3]|nr:phage shock E domain protein [Escherichia coli 3-105-05_S3_C3]
MFKKGLLALALVFSLPVFAAEHWIDVRVPGDAANLLI